MASNLYRLSVRRGPEEGKTFPLTSTSTTVGRDPMAEIVLSDPEVSRQHARFTRTEEGYQLQDLGSTNGTFIDGRRLTGEAVGLKPGAVITMGSNVTLVYEATSDPMATVISADPGFDFGELDEAEADIAQDDMAREPDVIEMPPPAPKVSEEPRAGFDEPAGFDQRYADFEEEIEEEAMMPGSEATNVEFPPLHAAEDEADEEPFSFDDIDYGAPAAPRAGAAPDDRTILDMEASDFSPYSSPAAGQPREEESLPSFSTASDLPDFDDEEYVAPAQKAPGRMPPPPPPPPVKEANPNRNRNIIIAVVVLLLLCCCCALITYFYLGDVLLEMMQELQV